MKLVAVTGAKRSGKSTLVQQVKDELLQNSVNIDGLLTFNVFAEDKFVGLDLLRIKTNEIVPFARIGLESSIRTMQFGFYPDAFNMQFDILCKTYKSDTVVLLDEIGILELKDMGWHPLMLDISEGHYKSVVLVVRKSIFYELTKKYNLRYDLLVDLDSTDFNLQTLKQRIVYFVC